MWLVNAMTLRLEEFISHEIAPEYVILSHTWGREEVSYQELSQEPRSESTQQKPGYAKIVNCCRLAMTIYGMNYAWVDTCCIDKKSSAELSEAINSMYTLYQSSRICIVYLADVRCRWKDDSLDLASMNFEKSRWFTRGWTLQELLAPNTCELYDSEWSRLGNARERAITEGIIKATNIKNLFLTDPKHCGIATKMSWAAHRKTTRIEDIAYCLLGLFDVAMPLLYGEGMKAFRRLQEEIIRKENDESIFAWASEREKFDNTTSYGGILAPSPAAFAYSGDIVPCLPPRETPLPYTITNYGLQIDLTYQKAIGPYEDPAIYDVPNWTHWTVPFACRKDDGSSGYFRVRLGEPSTDTYSSDSQKSLIFRRNPHSITFFKRGEVGSHLPSKRFYIQLSS